MKVVMYMDVWPGWTPQAASAQSLKPYEPTPGAKRLQFTIEVPDWMITTSAEADHVATVVQQAKEIV